MEARGPSRRSWSRAVRMDGGHRVVVLGGGFGGLAAAKKLGEAPVQVTLIDRRNFHLFQPLLYQVATGGLSPGDIAWPLRHLLRRQRNVRVIMAEAVSVDVQGRRVTLSRGEIPYDTLVVSAGASYSYFGNQQWEGLAPGLKRSSRPPSCGAGYCLPSRPPNWRPTRSAGDHDSPSLSSARVLPGWNWPARSAKFRETRCAVTSEPPIRLRLASSSSTWPRGCCLSSPRTYRQGPRSLSSGSASVHAAGSGWWGSIPTASTSKTPEVRSEFGLAR